MKSSLNKSNTMPSQWKSCLRVFSISPPPCFIFGYKIDPFTGLRCRWYFIWRGKGKIGLYFLQFLITTISLVWSQCQPIHPTILLIVSLSSSSPRIGPIIFFICGLSLTNIINDTNMHSTNKITRGIRWLSYMLYPQQRR